MPRGTQESSKALWNFAYGAFTLFGRPFQDRSATPPSPMLRPYNPDDRSHRFGLFRFRSPLLTESISLSLPPLTEMFHFSGFCVYFPMCSGSNDAALPASGYPIRKSPGQSVFAALRSLSQLITSFIACWHQGIHCVLFIACLLLLT